MKHGGHGGKLSCPLQFHWQTRCVEEEEEASDDGVGGSVKKPLETSKFWTAVDKQPEVLTLFYAPQMHEHHEPIDTLTDLPKWNQNGEKLMVAALLRPPALQYNKLWCPFSAPCTLRASWPGTRDPNFEDRFRLRSLVMVRPYCTAALFTLNDAIVNTPGILACTQRRMAELLRKSGLLCGRGR